MEELDAVFAEFGIEAKTDNQTEGKKKKRKDKKKDQSDGAQTGVVEAKQETTEVEEQENDENGQPLDPSVVGSLRGVPFVKAQEYETTRLFAVKCLKTFSDFLSIVVPS